MRNDRLSLTAPRSAAPTTGNFPVEAVNLYKHDSSRMGTLARPRAETDQWTGKSVPQDPSNRFIAEAGAVMPKAFKLLAGGRMTALASLQDASFVFNNSGGGASLTTG
jgi:hypothetical protein